MRRRALTLLRVSLGGAGVVAAAAALSTPARVALAAPPSAAPPPPPPPPPPARPRPAALRTALSRLDEMRDAPAAHTRQACLDEALRVVERFGAADPDVAWRAARAAYDVAELLGAPAAARKRELVTQAAAWARAAREHAELSATPGAVYRWAGIVASAESKFAPTAEYIKASFRIREDWERAVALDPADASALHLLGRWCFDVAALGWVQRRVAAALFAAPPTASYEDALAYFLRAEAVQPRFWKANQFYIAETQHKLGRRDEALRWVASALALPIKTLYDQQSHERTLALLRSIDAPAADAYAAAHAGDVTNVVQ